MAALLAALYRHDWVVYAKQPLGERGGPAEVLDYLARYTHKTVKLAACRALLDVPAPVPAVIEPVAGFMLRVAQVDLSRCSHCTSGRLLFVAA